jgi:hypothetical protein
MSTARFRVAVVGRPAWRVARPRSSDSVPATLAALRSRVSGAVVFSDENGTKGGRSRDRRWRPTKYVAARLLREGR